LKNAIRMIETCSDTHVEAARIQQQIKDYLGLRTSDLIFEYRSWKGGPSWTLSPSTPGTTSRVSFSFEKGSDKVDALKKMWSYVRTIRRKKTRIHSMGGQKRPELHTSYFRAE